MSLFVKDKFIRFSSEAILYLLVILLVLLPVDGTRSVKDICLVTALFLWFGRMAITRKWRLMRTPLDVPFFVYGVIILFSLCYAVDFFYSLNEVRGEYLKGLSLFYLVVNFVDTERKTRSILIALIAGNLVLVTYGLADFFLHGGSFVNRVGSGWHSLNEGGGTYSMYLVIVFPFLFWAVMTRAKRGWQILTIVLIVANILSAHISHQRGAWVAFFIMLILLGCFISKRWWARVTILTVTTSIALTAIYLAPEQMIRLKHLSLQEMLIDPGKNVNIRFNLWKMALHEIVNNPVIGAGFGRYSPREKYEWLRTSRPDLPALGHAHNTLLNLALELGIPGLCAFLFIMARFCTVALRHYRQSPSYTFYRFLMVALFIMTIGTIFRNMFDDFFINDTALLFWFMAGLCISFTLRNSKPVNT